MLFKHMTRTAGLLAAFALTGAFVLATTYSGTKERIAANERTAVLKNLNALVPTSQHDNDLLQDFVLVLDPDMLGAKKPVPIYRARLDNEPIALVFSVTAPDGYNGGIKLLVAIHHDGVIAGVRVVSHSETPGLGDAIDVTRSDWVLSFNGRSISNPTPMRWAVKKDGGVFDQFTGATITPRAIVKAVHKCLKYFAQKRDILFAAAPGDYIASNIRK